MLSSSRSVWGFAGGRALQHFDPAPDGRERIAQLMREDRQKLVLASVGLAQGVLQIIGLDRVRRLAGANVGEAQIAHRGLAWLSVGQAKHSEQVALGGEQRAKNCGPETADAHLLMKRRVARRRLDILDEALLAVTQDGGAARSFGRIDRRELIEITLVETALRKDFQIFRALVDESNGAESGAHHLDGCFEHGSKRLVQPIRSDDLRGEPLNTRHRLQLQAQVQLGELARRDVRKREHQAVDAVFDGSIRAYAQLQPAPVPRLHLGLIGTRVLATCAASFSRSA